MADREQNDVAAGGHSSGESEARYSDTIDWDDYWERLDDEMEIILGMDYAGYFLIVWDFIRWAKKQSIPVGPGRGSGAGSLVAYSMGITDIDPLPYDLLFERFLNPERVSMPDFDIDFCKNRRGDVIDYVTDKYGEKNVGQIITYGKLKAKGTIRDVGRTLNFSYGETDTLANLIPDEPGITLDEARAQEPKLRGLIEDHDRATETLLGDPVSSLRDEEMTFEPEAGET
ncbi:MAG: hypothetical protein ABEN55_09145, partial [Bradymonadaceae bacterium]